MEFTKERLLKIQSWSETYGPGSNVVLPAVEAEELARIALASLEAEASGRNPVLAYADSYRDMAKQGVESIPVWSVITDLERNIAPLFITPPAPVSDEDLLQMAASAIDDLLSNKDRSGAGVWADIPAKLRRAAMPPVIPDGYALVPIEPTTNQWAAGMQAFDSGMDKVTRVYKAMLAAAPQQEVKNGK